ncbi:MAG: ABC transporter ATP-binding protein [Pseudomonadota bacterium]|nr:ABC transporter ATP-binding protein [Pseudomonadota bacterium]MED5502054.1 ABC transporter ATP-binding protein [Pseudomonadota bacterium]|tara:strand:+ start:2078 stop:3109 length:1032 start_codon:yes stop_codon:yes gene_type:complete
MKLEIEDVSLSIEGNLILDNLSLNIDEHEIISLIGPSASGKSSLLRIIAGFENISSGKVKLNGLIVDDRSTIVQPQNRNIGIIFQDLALFPHLSCKDNIIFGITNYSEDHKRQRLDRLCNLLDITSIKDKFPHEISGGQQQRIAIARALAPGPEILLLDEPFSALDEELKETLIHDVKNLLKEEKITTIVITHNIKEAFQLSDKIAFLDNKKIIQFDTAYNLYHKPYTKEIANFCGIGSFIKGTVIDSNHVSTILGDLFGDTSKYKVGSNVSVMIRPDDIIHDDNSSQSAKVLEKIFFGSDFLYKLELSEGEKIFCYTPSHHNHAINEVIGIKPVIDHLILFS